MLKGVSVARLTLWKPPRPDYLANPCLASTGSVDRVV
jgi:hypothetical protein